MSILKPCPFCGSDEVESDISNGAAFIFCKEEGCRNLGLLMENEPFLDDIETAWNKRPREDQLIKENESLKAQLEKYKHDHAPEECTTLETLWFNRGAMSMQPMIDSLKEESDGRFFQIRDLKAQLKREVAITDMIERQSQVKGYPTVVEWRNILFSTHEIVKAREL